MRVAGKKAESSRLSFAKIKPLQVAEIEKNNQLNNH